MIKKNPNLCSHFVVFLNIIQLKVCATFRNEIACESCTCYIFKFNCCIHIKQCCQKYQHIAKMVEYLNTKNIFKI